MSIEENKSVVRQFFATFGSPSSVDALLTPSYVHHDPALPPEMQHGREAYKQVVAMFNSAFPDLQTTVEDLIAEGDMVAARWTWRGTHRGAFQGIPPTGKLVGGPGLSIHRLADGKIVEGWFSFDALGLMQQLGVIPAPGQPATAH